MNKIVAAALVSAATLMSATAFAQEATPDPAPNGKSERTRAEVHAELIRARDAGELKVFEEGYFPQVASTRTRAEVVAELKRAQANGEYAALHAEPFDPVVYQDLVAKNQEASRYAAQPAAPAVQ
ncbi:DUF4148 domain-containing protein [Caldimonas brevitalea]|uniref:DUF4148 domain-containing protein n=1 Tax=Caldimonas brevitalea TaxID=413882 RepID=A0A0G3BXD5_9BURK|nr:DUF4148 domain-containing protein [Caldimonas brevitalea]AKJ31190.1 hypothetical protein AAW51_4499 [Caldimonas brevitalea]